MEKEDTSEEEQDTESNTDEGDKSEENNLIQQAREEREKLEATIKEREKQIEKEEELATRLELGGGSRAGRKVKKPKEETPKEYKDKIMSGEI